MINDLWGWGSFGVSLCLRIEHDSDLFISAQTWLISKELWHNSYTQVMRHFSIRFITDTWQTQTKNSYPQKWVESIQYKRVFYPKNTIQRFDSKATGNAKNGKWFRVNGCSQKLTRAWQGYFHNTTDRGWLFFAPLPLKNPGTTVPIYKIQTAFERSGNFV